MKWITLVFVLLLTPTAQADEKAVYVGEGRYSSPRDSVDNAVLKQRNQEQTRKAQERDENARRNESEDRRDRANQRDYESSRY